MEGGCCKATDVGREEERGREEGRESEGGRAACGVGYEPMQEIGILLPNNQRQHRTLHIQKNVLPYPLCQKDIQKDVLPFALCPTHCASLYNTYTRLGPLSSEHICEREFFIDNLLVRIHYIIVRIKWTGLAPWEHIKDSQGQIPALAFC